MFGEHLSKAFKLFLKSIITVAKETNLEKIQINSIRKIRNIVHLRIYITEKTAFTDNLLAAAGMMLQKMQEI